MEKRIITLLLFGLCFSGSKLLAQVSGISGSEEKLKEIKTRIETTTEKLKAYEKLQSELQSDMKVLKVNHKHTRRRIDDADLNLNSARENMHLEKQKLAALSFAYENRLKDFANGVLGSLILEKLKNPYFEDGRFASGLFLKFYIYKNAKILKALKGQISKIGQALDFLAQEIKSLADSLDILKKDEKKILTDLEVKKSKLTDTKINADEIRAEIKNLQKSEKDLISVLVSLKKRSVEKMLNADSSLPVAGYSLDWPVRGRVISYFGKKKIASLDIEFNKQGIKIETVKNAEVKSVKTGVVIYRGYFRSYGNVIILDHGQEFFTVYGLLSKLFVSQGQIVSQGEVIALSGDDNSSSLEDETLPAGSSVLYFEIRRGTNPLNPLNWLKKR